MIYKIKVPYCAYSGMLQHLTHQLICSSQRAAYQIAHGSPKAHQVYTVDWGQVLAPLVCEIALCNLPAPHLPMRSPRAPLLMRNVRLGHLACASRSNPARSGRQACRTLPDLWQCR